MVMLRLIGLLLHLILICSLPSKMDSSVKGEAYGWPNFGEFSCISRSNYIYCDLHCWSSIVIALKVKTNLKQVHEDLEMQSDITKLTSTLNHKLVNVHIHSSIISRKSASCNTTYQHFPLSNTWISSFF